jgi:putative oxidoreductase
MNTQLLDTWSRRVLSILRIVTAVLFLEHGLQKLFGLPALSPNGSTAPLFSLMGGAGILELVGGAVLVLGLYTRPVAFILSGEMAFAYWMVHAPKSPFPVLNGGDSAILYCFIFLYLVFSGPGPWSLDESRRARELHSTP